MRVTSLGFPPGVPFVLSLLASLLAPLAFLYVAADVLHQTRGIALSTPAFLALYLASLPVLFFAQVFLRRARVARAARTHGARVINRALGRWPGNIDILITAVRKWEGYLGDVIREQKVKGSPGHTFNLNILWDTVIFTTEPEYIKTVLATDFANYPKGDVFQAQMQSVLGTGVFNSDGDMWKFHRSITRPFFSRERITHFELYEEHARTAIAAMRQRFKEGYALDFQDLIARFTLDAATAFLFGRCVHSLAAPLPYPHAAPLTAGAGAGERFANAFAQAQGAIALRALVGKFWRAREIAGDSTAAPMRVVNAYVAPIMQEAVARRVAEGGGKEGKTDEVGESDTLLDYLVKHTTDPTILKDEILNIMIAGRDTTANTINCAVYLLATAPRVLAALRAEIIARVGPARPPTYDDIREMKYLRAVINETLRLFPAVPFNIRHSVNASTWPSVDPVDPRPLYIPPKTDIIYSVFMMHRRKDLWGEDAEEFDPERFLDARLQRLAKNPFMFLPFNAGPRICLGQQFAYNEVSFMLVRLLQAFGGIALDPSAQPPESRPPAAWRAAEGRKAYERFWPRSHLTVYAKGGLWLKMTEAPSEGEGEGGVLAL